MSEHDPEAPLPDEPHPPVIEHQPEPVASPPPPVAVRRGGTPLPLTLLLAALLGGGIYWTWTHPKAQGQAAPTDLSSPADPLRAQLDTQAQATSQQMQALSARLDALEKQPHPAEAGPTSPDAATALSKRLDDMSGHLDALSAKQDALTGEIQKQADAPQKPVETGTATPDPALAALPGLLAQQKSAVDALDQRLSKLEGASGQAPAQTQPTADEKPRIDSMDQRLAKLESAQSQDQTSADEKTQIDALQQRLAKLEDSGAQARAQGQDQDQAALAALDGRVGRLEQGQGAVQGAVRGVAQDAGRAIRLEAAQTSLAAGQPLGNLPGAPPALARFADSAPPTEASLRAAFPKVAEAARAASQPNLRNRSFFDRALARLQQSVTVRQGDHVIVGDPASGVLARAQQELDEGDLKGTVDTLSDLNGPAAAATNDWVAQARALLDARAALAAMARG